MLPQIHMRLFMLQNKDMIGNTNMTNFFRRKGKESFKEASTNQQGEENIFFFTEKREYTKIKRLFGTKINNAGISNSGISNAGVNNAGVNSAKIIFYQVFGSLFLTLSRV